MPYRILVTYATRSGSTAGVAEAIGQTLAEEGWSVDVLAMQEVTDLAPYQAVVVGSAIQSARWLPEAMGFIQTNQAAMRRIPCAVFLVCLTLAMPNANKYRAHVADFLQPVRAIVHPVSEGLFAGVLDISKVPSFWGRLKFRLSVLFRVWAEGDHRDWDAIRVWANSLRPLLLRESNPSGVPTG